MPTLSLDPAIVPVDLPLPESAQELVNLITSYVSVSGATGLKGVIVSTSEPAADDRDKAWVKVDPATNRSLGVYTYFGGWKQVPVIAQSGTTPPANAKAGELFYNTDLKALMAYDGTGWTTNLFPSGSTANRPDSVSVGFLYFDNDIARLLRYTASGWTTFDGGIGDVKMVDFADENTALTSNPGWSVFASMKGRFPLAANDSITPQTEGGNSLDGAQFKWSTTGISVQGGSRDTNVLAGLKLGGVDGGPQSKMNSPTAVVTDQNINVTPPYKALIFLRKDY